MNTQQQTYLEAQAALQTATENNSQIIREIAASNPDFSRLQCSQALALHPDAIETTELYALHNEARRQLVHWFLFEAAAHIVSVAPLQERFESGRMLDSTLSDLAAMAMTHE